VFIAGPLLVHWKEREPVYTNRYRRIREQLGYVPPYAVATAGAPVDVEPDRKKVAAGSVTAPQDPSQVSRAEFDDMVKNLGIEDDAAAKERKPAAAAAGSRPAGGRRARARAAGEGGATPPREGEGSGPTPPDGGTPKKPRNRRHGRPR